jgi:hypothetical protein
MIHRDIESLRIDFQETVLFVLEEFKKRRIPYSILETFREQGVQDCYYAQGREPLEKVNSLRKANGLYLLSEKENNVITKTRNSNHTKGIAIDIAPFDVYSGRNIWNYNDPVWKKIAEIAKELENSVSWGGNWIDFYDPPHWEKKQ